MYIYNVCLSTCCRNHALYFAHHNFSNNFHTFAYIISVQLQKYSLLKEIFKYMLSYEQHNTIILQSRITQNFWISYQTWLKVKTWVSQMLIQ